MPCSFAGQVDPTQPLSGIATQGEPVSESKLTLESIVHGEGIHTAVINGQVIKVNESIGQYRLVAVNNDSVVLSSESERLKLFVFKASVLK